MHRQDDKNTRQEEQRDSHKGSKRWYFLQFRPMAAALKVDSVKDFVKQRTENAADFFS